ncbi:DUF4258 domain-containing protein [Heliobacterium undosum]|uniref:DUF4258 domain-containing protein n=1 Tax=Heliomicrobium undosum TaxID=121734 RepID=A0A845L661_9FIRM|nr:DUF4258 domain-containing protein [Heliomicrobium undosum]
MNPWIVLLRKAAEDVSYEISEHAANRMLERNVLPTDLQNCCATGQVIDEQRFGADVKVVLESRDRNGIPFYAVVALSFPQPTVVTVCRFRKDTWADIGYLARRKRR